MKLLLTTDEMRRFDKRAISELGIPGIVLMENAARAVIDEVHSHFDDDISDLPVVVLCGPGNNGGDGFAVARHLLVRGAEVHIYLFAPRESLQGDAKTNADICENLKIPIQVQTRAGKDFSLDSYPLIVDALLGTGIRRAPSKSIAAAISAINRASGFVLSVDIPSGVNGSTGEVMGEAVRAEATVTFGYAKRGLYLHPGRDYVGELTVANISIPPFADLEEAAPLRVLEFSDVSALLPERPRHAHKGDFGKVFVLAGSQGLTGAAAMVAEAILRVGAGMVTVGCPQSVLPLIAGRRAEVMTRPLAETKSGCLSQAALDEALKATEWADVVVIGPGLGLDGETTRLLEAYVPELNKPIVVDADGLNHVARSARLKRALPRGSIITPHAGEFSRITKKSISDVLKQPVDAAGGLAAKSGWIVVLKGAPTFTADPGGLVFLNPTGNPGLATAGSGDALTGMIAGLLAQGSGPMWAATVGVFLHGLAGDLAASQLGEASLIAGDIIEALPSAFATVEGGEE